MSHHDHKLPSMRIGRASEMLPGDMLQGVMPIDMDALERIVAIRHDQIGKYGHTPESDALLPVDHIPEAVKRYAHRAWNRLHNNGSRQLAIGELERCAALCLAAIARIKQEDKQ